MNVDPVLLHYAAALCLNQVLRLPVICAQIGVFLKLVLLHQIATKNLIYAMRFSNYFQNRLQSLSLLIC